MFVFFRPRTGLVGYSISAFLLTLLATTPGRAEVNFRIITPAGWVGFVAEDHWPVLASETRFPVAAMVFQIPNPQDEGTPDSTNLVITLIETGSKSKEAVATRAKIGQRTGAAEPIEDADSDWTTYTQPATQGQTLYIVVDATREIADMQVWVRLAWPAIGADPDAYHKKMGLLLDRLLQSVSGGLGKPERRPGEVIRRPAQ